MSDLIVIVLFLVMVLAPCVLASVGTHLEAKSAQEPEPAGEAKL